MFMDRMIAPINVHRSYKLKIVYKTREQKHSVNHVFLIYVIKFLTSHDRELVKIFPFMYQLLM